MTLAFTVYGVAQPKGNHRALNLKGMKFPVITETNRNVKSWQQLVSEGASHALQQLPESERAMLEHAVRLTIAFYLPRPKKHGKRGVFVPHCVAPDIDKLERAILDALSQVAYRDDKQVTEVIKGKYYAGVDEPAHVDVRVEPAPGERLTVPPSTRPLFGAASSSVSSPPLGTLGEGQAQQHPTAVRVRSANAGGDTDVVRP